MLDFVSGTAAGLRLALIVFAFMTLLASHRPRDWVMLLIAISVLVYSPAHASWLLGHPWQRLQSTSLDVICSAMACAAFITYLARLARDRGISIDRVRRGTAVNVFLLLSIVGLAWLTR